MVVEELVAVAAGSGGGEFFYFDAAVVEAVNCGLIAGEERVGTVV